MPNVGPLELAIVLVIALIVFGPKKVPELGRSLGRGIREFRGSLAGAGDDNPKRTPSGQLELGAPSETVAAEKSTSDPRR